MLGVALKLTTSTKREPFVVEVTKPGTKRDGSHNEPERMLLKCPLALVTQPNP